MRSHVFDDLGDPTRRKSQFMERVGEVDVVDGALVQQPQASLSTSGKAGFDDAGLEKTAQVFLADTPTGEEVDWTRVSILSRLSCLSFLGIAPPRRFLRHPRVDPKALCDAGKGHAQPAKM